MTGIETLALVGTIASVGGSIVSGLGQMQAGRAANASAKFQAAQLEQRVGQERAAAQRQAIEERRKAAFAISRGQAVAAASGGGATDPTVLDVTGGVAAQGEYNALSALFEGEERARGAQLQATATRMEGKQAKKAGMIGGLGTIAGGVGQTLYMRYGDSAGAGGKKASSYNPNAYGPYDLPWMRK